MGSTEWQITNPNPVPLTSVPEVKVRYNWVVYDQLDGQGNVLQSAQGWDNGNPNPVNTMFARSISLEWYLVIDGSAGAIMGTVIANADEGSRCQS